MSTHRRVQVWVSCDEPGCAQGYGDERLFPAETSVGQALSSVREGARRAGWYVGVGDLAYCPVDARKYVKAAS